MSNSLRVRRSLADIQADYDAGNKQPLERLMRAWVGIQKLNAQDPRSFFTIGGYHGEPFRGEGATQKKWWGGYCQHGTVLFPTWHRAYLLQLERAMQTIDGCEDVMLPFWDECSTQSAGQGIPKALTSPTFELDGQTIRNPLRAFTLPQPIDDHLQGDQSVSSKPAGYETVRYPLSGLVGTEPEKAATRAHNEQFPDYEKNVTYLNDNVMTWLNGKIYIAGKWRGEVVGKFLQSLDAPNYTLFSNGTSSTAWNKLHDSGVVSLEQPHNFMHLAVGGFDYPGQGSASAIPGANGDMGENDTAGLDPIFFFHHCFIDYTFWVWQRRHGTTNTLTINSDDPGANYDADHGVLPPAGTDDTNQPLTVDTPLKPFLDSEGVLYTTNRCTNIETQLGYTYGPGSLDQYAQQPLTASATASPDPAPSGHTVVVRGLNRGAISGSFLISAYSHAGGKREYIGTEPVLSRWDVAGCMNCQNHLEARATFQMSPETVAGLTEATDGGVEVEVQTRGGVLSARVPHPQSPQTTSVGTTESAPFTVEIQ